MDGSIQLKDTEVTKDTLTKVFEELIKHKVDLKEYA